MSWCTQPEPSLCIHSGCWDPGGVPVVVLPGDAVQNRVLLEQVEPKSRKMGLARWLGRRNLGKKA